MKRDDGIPLDIDTSELMDRIEAHAGRRLSLDEWGFVVGALRCGKTVEVKDGKIYFLGD